MHISNKRSIIHQAVFFLPLFRMSLSLLLFRSHNVSPLRIEGSNRVSFNADVSVQVKVPEARAKCQDASRHPEENTSRGARARLFFL